MIISKKLDNQVGQFFGVMSWLWFALSGITVVFFLLANLHNDTQFKTTQTFIDIFLISFAILGLLSSIGKYSQYIKNSHEGDVKLFYMQNVTLKKIPYIPIGILAVFLVSYGLSGQNPFFGILVSGFVMVICFDRTRSILVPIWIHGAYNSIVVLFQEGYLHDLVPSLDVPNIGLTVKTFGTVGSEVINQNVLVATSEELLKIMVFSFVIVVLASKFKVKDKSAKLIVAYIIGVILWAVLHTINAI